MAYSKIEQAYLDGLVQAQFPDPVEPEPTLLASADTGITTDGGAYVGTRLNMPKGLNTPENMQAVGNDIPKTVAGVAKGMAQGFVGLPGDLEGIGRLVLNYMGADVNEQTKLPTTQDVKGFLDQYIKLPELQTSDMSNFETAGEWLAPGGQLKAVKPVAKAIKGAVKMTEGLPVGLSTKAVGQGVDELGFYSAAQKAVDSIQQPKGTGDQFLKQIEKTPGVKPEEIKWTGLDDFLKSKKTVTKQEVSEYLAANRVEVKEVQLRDPTPDDVRALMDDEAGQGMTYDEAFDYLKNDEGMTKFSKYTLPGGENYREVLLTLPGNKARADNLDDAFKLWMADAKAGKRGQYSKEELASITVDDVQDILKEEYLTPSKKGEFRSQHFDQPNILAHLRVDDRIDADGKKVLMVEEVQSDWHQAGRKQGYKDPATKEEYQALEKELMAVNREALPYITKGEDAPQNLIEKKVALSERMDALDKQYNKGVANAPFKTTWQELAMKRAIQMAAEGGYDRIAFTTGKTQAERFDLSKQVERITAIKDGDNFKIMGIDIKGNSFDLGKKSVDELPEILGKDLADKIAKQETPNAQYAGKDLVVGGEGMAGFYDNILPKFLDKYAKKWDAKTGMSEIKAGDKNEPVHYIDITPKMRESVMTKGQPMFAIGAGGAGAATQQNQEKK